MSEEAARQDGNSFSPPVPAPLAPSASGRQAFTEEARSLMSVLVVVALIGGMAAALVGLLAWARPGGAGTIRGASPEALLGAMCGALAGTLLEPFLRRVDWEDDSSPEGVVEQ